MIKVKKISSVINNVIYYFVLISCAIIAISITGQRFFYPNKIPDIFGWKLFVVFDEKMVDEIKSGDLVFAKIVNTNDLNVNDAIAFRNNLGYVTIHKILGIEEENKKDIKIKKFLLKTQENELIDTKYVLEENVEGKIIHRIPKLGKILYDLQKPVVLIFIYSFTLVIGGIWIYIAGKLDEKDINNVEVSKEIEKQEEKENENSEKSLKL